MFIKLNDYYNKNPLLFILIIAIIPRLIAAIFAKGYGMHDDMFAPVQDMQIALDDFTTISKNPPNLLLYPFCQYIIFWFCELLNIFDPQSKMLLVRILHSFYSLFIIYFGYKIAILLSDTKTARQIGIILSLIWFLPYMNVRNLVEVVSIPPLLAGIYFVLKKDADIKLYFAGLCFAIAFLIRFQTAIIPFGVVIFLIFDRQFKHAIILSLTAIVISASLLCLQDIYFWNEPFITLINYFNVKDIDSYPVTAWYNTFLLSVGVLIPPMSLLLFYGFIRNYRENLILFIPIFLFLLFHSIYPNKQERFLLTIIPLLIIASVVSWNNLKHKYVKLIKLNWIWFWSINTILLVIFCFSYTKRTRVEAFTFLADKKINAIIIDVGDDNYHPPRFYLGKNMYKPILFVTNTIKQHSESTNNYFIIFNEENLEQRINYINEKFNVNLKQIKQIEPGLLDNLLYKMNPKHNKNYTAFIFVHNNIAT